MYFLRIAGAAVLVLSGFIGSRMMNLAISKKWEQTEALVSLLRFIKIQIECFGLPASEIISRCDRELIFQCGFSKDILPNDFKSFFKSCYFRDGETQSILYAFATGFGKGYREEQVKECEYYLELLCERRQRLYEDLPKRKKLNSTLCISSALAIVILLI